MSVSGIGSSSLLSMLSSLNANANAGSGSGAALSANASPATVAEIKQALTGGEGPGSAYTLSVGQPNLTTRLQGYGALGKLASQAGASLSNLEQTLGLGTADTVTAGAQTLVSSFNTLLSGVSGLTASGGGLAADPSLAAGLQTTLQGLPGQTFTAPDGSSMSLSDIGITAASDGSLSIDGTTLQSAATRNPSAVASVLRQMDSSISGALTGMTGSDGTIASHIGSLVNAYTQSMVSGMLSGDGSGTSTGTDPLLAMLSGSGSTSSSTASDPYSQISSLLAGIS